MKAKNIITLLRRKANSIAIPDGDYQHLFIDDDGLLKMRKPDGSLVIMVEDSELFRLHGIVKKEDSDDIVIEHPFNSVFVRASAYSEADGIVPGVITDAEKVTFTLPLAVEGDPISILIEKLGESDPLIMTIRPWPYTPPVYLTPGEPIVVGGDGGGGNIKPNP